MKKVFISIVVSVTCITYSSAYSCTDLQTNLTKGKETSDVLTLQNFLFDKGYLTNKPNGYFGNGTFLAVKKFQKSVGLSQSGGVLPLTRAAIKKETCTSTQSVSNTQQKNSTVIKSNDVVTTTPVKTETSVPPVKKVPTTPNEQRQNDTTRILKAVYEFYQGPYRAYPGTITSTPIEICTLGISLCDSMLEIKSYLVPRFLDKIPNDPGVASSSKSGYFISKTTDNTVRVSAPSSTLGKEIYSECNFTSECSSIRTADSPPLPLGVPVLSKIINKFFYSGGASQVPLVIEGSNFSTSTNIITLVSQSTRRQYFLSTASSTNGLTISASSSFTLSPVSCGVNCTDTLPVGSYSVTVKTPAGESNQGMMYLRGVTVRGTSNTTSSSLKPKSTHVKLGTVTLSSSGPVTLKSLTFTIQGTSTLVAAVSTFTLTDAVTGKITNSGPKFSLLDEVVGENQAKVYELYANIADIDTSVSAGRLNIGGTLEMQDYVEKTTTKVEIPSFVVTISY